MERALSKSAKPGSLYERELRCQSWHSPSQIYSCGNSICDPSDKSQKHANDCILKVKYRPCYFISQFCFSSGICIHYAMHFGMFNCALIRKRSLSQRKPEKNTQTFLTHISNPSYKSTAEGLNGSIVTQSLMRCQQDASLRPLSKPGGIFIWHKQTEDLSLYIQSKSKGWKIILLLCSLLSLKLCQILAHIG